MHSGSGWLPLAPSSHGIRCACVCVVYVSVVYVSVDDMWVGDGHTYTQLHAPQKHTTTQNTPHTPSHLEQQRSDDVPEIQKAQEVCKVYLMVLHLHAGVEHVDHTLSISPLSKHTPKHTTTHTLFKHVPSHTHIHTHLHRLHKHSNGIRSSPPSCTVQATWQPALYAGTPPPLPHTPHTSTPHRPTHPNKPPPLLPHLPLLHPLIPHPPRAPLHTTGRGMQITHISPQTPVLSHLMLV